MLTYLCPFTLSVEFSLSVCPNHFSPSVLRVKVLSKGRMCSLVNEVHTSFSLASLQFFCLSHPFQKTV